MQKLLYAKMPEIVKKKKKTKKKTCMTGALHYSPVTHNFKFSHTSNGQMLQVAM